MENTNRPTIEFATESGVKFILKSYITGREYNAMQSIYTDGAKVNLVGGAPQIEGFDPKSEEKVTQKLIEFAVVSVNGSTDNVLETVLELPSKDYLELLDKLDEVNGKKKPADTKIA